MAKQSGDIGVEVAITKLTDDSLQRMKQARRIAKSLDPLVWNGLQDEFDIAIRVMKGILQFFEERG